MQSAVVFNKAIQKQSDTTFYYVESVARDEIKTVGWNDATTVMRQPFLSSFIVNTGIVDRFQSQPFFSVHLTGLIYDDRASQRALLNTDSYDNIHLDFTEKHMLPAWDETHFRFGWIKPDRPIVPHDSSTLLTARQAAPRDSNHRLPWGTGQSIWHNWNLPYPVEENLDPDTIPDQPEIKTVYLIMNTLEIVDVETNTPLDIKDVKISLDIDSLAWTFSGTIYGDGSLALVQPDSDGMKDISIKINGHRWVFAIKSYKSDERFPTLKHTLSGVSRTQYMAAPFAPTYTATNAEATTAAQAATAILENTGFTLDWPTGEDENLPDWGILAGALNYQDKTPAQVIAQIVTAAGGVMIPSLAADGWTIQPRYKILPWQWNSKNADVVVYADMIRSRAGNYEPGQEFDACYVSGIEQGVSVDVQRTGSGGLNPMPDIYDDLICETAPAIYRGRSELAASGNKVVETISVIIPESAAAPGIITPGQIVQVTHDNTDQDYKALVLSTSISLSHAGGAA